MVALMTHFYQRNLFVYSINVLNFNDFITTPIHYLIKTVSAHDCLQRI